MEPLVFCLVLSACRYYDALLGNQLEGNRIIIIMIIIKVSDKWWIFYLSDIHTYYHLFYSDKLIQGALTESFIQPYGYTES